MSTWHQDRAGNGGPPPGADNGTWKVWTNPPGGMSCTMAGFSSKAAAQDYIDRCDVYRPGEKTHSRVIPPV